MFYLYPTIDFFLNIQSQDQRGQFLQIFLRHLSMTPN